MRPLRVCVLLCLSVHVAAWLPACLAVRPVSLSLCLLGGTTCPSLPLPWLSLVVAVTASSRCFFAHWYRNVPAFSDSAVNADWTFPACEQDRLDVRGGGSGGRGRTELPLSKVAPCVLEWLEPTVVGRLACTCRVLRDLVRLDPYRHHLAPRKPPCQVSRVLALGLLFTESPAPLTRVPRR